MINDYVLPKNWVFKKLGDIADVTSSKRVFESEWKTYGVPFYRAREIVKLAKQGFVNNEIFISEQMFNEYSEKYGNPQENDIMITGVGTLGVCYLVKKDDKFYFKDGNIIWVKNIEDSISSKYLFYILNSELIQKQIKFFSSGNTVGTYTIENAKKTIIPLPPLEEQKHIVKIIETKLTVVNKAMELIKEQQSIIDILLDAYFHEYLNKNIIPENCEIKRLGDICIEDKIIIDGRNSDLPFLGLEMVKSKTGEIDLETQTMPGVSTCYYFDERHILYGKLRPYLNKVALPDFKGRCSTELVPLFVKPEYNKEFISYLLRQNETVNYIMQEKTGSRMPRANMQYLLNMKVLTPSLSEQNRITNIIKSKTRYVNNLKKIIDEQYIYITALPSSILRKAFNGDY
jgi:type I restriction enzyme S subunit